MQIELTAEEISNIKGALLFLLITHRNMFKEGKLIFDDDDVMAMIENAQDQVKFESDLKAIIRKLDQA